MNQTNSSNFAGLIIDMQSSFLRDIEAKEREKMIQSQIELIRYLSEKDIPIFILEFYGEGKTIDEIAKEIDFNKNEKPLTKITEWGFYRTGLHKKLKKNKIENIILMGINAMACVKMTAENALQKGYHIYTARNLIAEKEKYTDREMNLKIESWYTILGTFFKTGKELQNSLESQ